MPRPKNGTTARGKPQIRCAVYTRKSSEEGLEQDFNSLDAQRESCEAFIRSQKHEGWLCLSEMYDDGGISGATMERPALKRLLADIEAGSVEVALRLNPNDPDQMVWCALYHVYAGEFAAAHAVFVAAEQLNPLPPIWYKGGKAITEYGLRHYATAAQLFESLVSDPRFWEPSAWIHYYLAACYERLGRTLEAKSEIARALELKPDLSLRVVAVTDPYVRADDLEHLLEPLRKAGLSE